jgi:alpha-tubulin suppressor-like RCC1 family protein
VGCWGGNEFGEIGDAVAPSRREDRRTPTPVVGLASDVVEITAQGKHTCARKADGTLWCWGRTRAGDLDPAAQIPSLPEVDEAPSCVVRPDGRIWCHGYNGHGELGDGTTVHRESPAPVITREPAFDAVYLGPYHVLARKVDGTVWGWGANESGQIGDGTLESRRVPVEIAALGVDVEEVVAGTAYSCARRRDGTVWCWGSNHQGELGDGTTADRSTPAAVVDLGSGVVEIAAGLSHTCARKDDGDIWCWGDNAHGQVGDGSTADRTRPAKIVGGSRWSTSGQDAR